MCAEEEVAVVGGANSAGQAAVFLAETAKRVHMVIRADALSQTMSRYLISRIDAQGNVLVSTATDIGRGDYGVYNADTGLVTLLGNVTITRGENAIRGQYAVVDLNNNVSRMLPTAGRPGSLPSRVEGIFIRQNPPDAQGPNAATGSSQKP